MIASPTYNASKRMLVAVPGFYFCRIERLHHERVSADGPVLFPSNHPNSMTETFVIGV